MRWRLGRPPAGPKPLNRSQVIMGESHGLYLVSAGLEASIPCITCNLAAGLGPVKIEYSVIGTACPDDGTHLLAAAFLRHADCPIPDDSAIGPRLVELMSFGDHR